MLFFCSFGPSGSDSVVFCLLGTGDFFAADCVWSVDSMRAALSSIFFGVIGPSTGIHLQSVGACPQAGTVVSAARRDHVGQRRVASVLAATCRDRDPYRIIK